MLHFIAKIICKFTPVLSILITVGLIGVWGTEANVRLRAIHNLLLHILC